MELLSLVGKSMVGGEGVENRGGIPTIVALTSRTPFGYHLRSLWDAVLATRLEYYCSTVEPN